MAIIFNEMESALVQPLCAARMGCLRRGGVGTLLIYSYASIELAGLSPGVRYPTKTLQERLDLRFCKELAVGVKFRQQRWQGLSEGGEDLLKFRERATKGTNSLQVFAQSQSSFCFVFPDALPIPTGEARRSTMRAFVR